MTSSDSIPKRGRGRPRGSKARPERADDLLSPAEVARRLGFSPKTVGDWLKAGRLPFVVVMGWPRITVAAVEAVRRAPAVEQFMAAFPAPATNPARQMGSAGEKMLAMSPGAAGLTAGIPGAENGGPSGEKPRAFCHESFDFECVSDSAKDDIPNEAAADLGSGADGAVLTRGGGGPLSSGPGDGRMDSDGEKISALLREVSP